MKGKSTFYSREPTHFDLLCDDKGNFCHMAYLDRGRRCLIIVFRKRATGCTEQTLHLYSCNLLHCGSLVAKKQISSSRLIAIYTVFACLWLRGRESLGIQGHYKGFSNVSYLGNLVSQKQLLVLPYMQPIAFVNHWPNQWPFQNAITLPVLITLILLQNLR